MLILDQCNFDGDLLNVFVSWVRRIRTCALDENNRILEWSQVMGGLGGQHHHGTSKISKFGRLVFIDLRVTSLKSNCRGHCTSLILTVWPSCWGRSPGVTPDGAPCCCTPPSGRTAGFSRCSWSVHHMICNQMIACSKSSRWAAEPRETATGSCSRGTGRPLRRRLNVLVINGDDGSLLRSVFARKSRCRHEPKRDLCHYLPPPCLARLPLGSAVFRPTEVYSFVCRETHL